MQIRFPRKIRLGFRPVYGLTIRQLIYLAVFGIAGGLMILAGPVQGTSILVRAIIGVVIMVAGLALAFLRIGGISIDEWLPIGARFLLRPRIRVWRKRDVPRPVTQAPKVQVVAEPEPTTSRTNFKPNPDVEPIAQQERRAVLTTALVVIDAFVLLVLGAMTVYLRQGGFAQVQVTLAQLLR
mgnify:CR=1 FL=1